MRDLKLTILWVLPFTALLFFFVPRILNPIPFQQNQSGPGEIGYTPDVNVSEIESLTPNPTPVFQVMLSKNLKPDGLYWRGNTLTNNDGWNWSLHPMDMATPSATNLVGEVNQTIRLFSRADFFFGLDRPEFIRYGQSTLRLPESGAIAQKKWRWIQRYEVQSASSDLESSAQNIRPFLKTTLAREEKEWIQQTFKGTTPQEIRDEMKKYFQAEKFSYSLSPGKSKTFGEFMRSKKIGLCSHYASALAIILRVKNIPARLVSGFLGGTYNRFAHFYLITQNDAHVWVEALHDGKWSRLDPTSWIAPDRISLSGEAFMEARQGKKSDSKNLIRIPAFVQDFRQWFAQWDFRFYQWIDQTDYYSQEAWLERLKLNRTFFYMLMPGLIALFGIVYFLFLKNKKRIFTDELSEIWGLYQEKLITRGLNLPFYSIADAERILTAWNHPDREKFTSIWKELLELSFKDSKKQPLELKKKLKSL